MDRRWIVGKSEQVISVTLLELFLLKALIEMILRIHVVLTLIHKTKQCHFQHINCNIGNQPTAEIYGNVYL